MTAQAPVEALTALASAYGVEDGYEAVDGTWHRADPEAMVQVLAALGAPLDGPRGVDAALAEVRAARHHRLIEPVVAVHDGAEAVSSVVAEGTDPSSCSAVLTTEDGRELVLGSTGTGRGRDGRTRVRWGLGGVASVPGYHRLTVTSGNRTGEALLLVAPRCPRPARSWGVFEPLAAVRGAADRGIGTYADLAEMADWAGDLGAAFVGTLPLLPTLSEPTGPGGRPDPSPYLPATRLGWSDLHLPTGSPGLEPGPEGPVDFATVAADVHFHLAPRAEHAFHPDGPDRRGLETFTEAHPELVAYARFLEHRVERGVAPPPRDPDADAVWCDPGTLGPTGRYQLYAQWRADEALRALADRLYLDLPVGVHPAGFDPWWFAGSFVDGVEGGAPPDTFFAEGQCWGFRPLDPVALRRDDYRYVRACLRHLMTRAAVVRIDHVMGLHRMYWVPRGADARHGVYVRSRLEELRAVVSIEAARSGTVVVGEDLGTVPDEMRSAMAASGMQRSWVLEFEVSSEEPWPDPPEDSMASIGTHDLPRFAAYWDGDDLDEAESAGRAGAGVAEDRARRDGWRATLAARGTDDPATALGIGLVHLAGGPAAMVLVDLEDLWLERRPVNRPGTTDGRNWRGRSARTLAEVRADGDVATTLRAVDAARRGDGAGAAVPDTAEPGGAE